MKVEVLEVFNAVRINDEGHAIFLLAKVKEPDDNAREVYFFGSVGRQILYGGWNTAPRNSFSTPWLEAIKENGWSSLDHFEGICLHKETAEEMLELFQVTQKSIWVVVKELEKELWK